MAFGKHQSNKILAKDVDFWRKTKKKRKLESSKNYEHSIIQEIVQRRLRWFGHFKRMGRDRIPKKDTRVECRNTRKKGRPREQWMDGE